MATKREHDASKIINSEPLVSKLDPTSDNYTVTLMRINNWYSAEKNRADSYKYYTQYVKKNRPTDVKYFAEVEEKDVHITYGWMARMLLQGATMSDQHNKAFDKNLTDLIDLGKARLLAKETVVTVAITSSPVKRISIQDAMKEKASEYIGELEGAVDEFCVKDAEFNLYNHLKGIKFLRRILQMLKCGQKRNCRNGKRLPSQKIRKLLKVIQIFQKERLQRL